MKIHQIIFFNVGNILVRFKMPEDSFWGLVKQALGLRCV